MSESVQQVNPNRLLALLKDGMQTKSKSRELAGAHGQRVKDAIESGHLHRGAFNDVKNLAGMDELKRLELMRTRQLYYDMLVEKGFFGATHHGDLADQAKGAADKDFDDADPNKQAAEKNGEALNDGIKQLVPPDPNAKESQTSKATRKRQEAETAAQAAVQKTIDDETRGSRFNKRPAAETIN